MNQRCPWIDIAKGVAILLVLLSHSEFWSFCRAHSDLYLISIVEHIIKIAIASYMPLFFVLSGYTYKERPNILKKRFERLVFPYMIWGGLALLASWIMLCTKEVSTLAILKPAMGLIYSRCTLFPSNISDNIYLLPAGARPLWFLTSLFTSYILFIPLARCSKHNYLIAGVYVAIAFLLSLLPILLPWSLDTAPVGALFIFVGYVLKRKAIFLSPKRWLIISAVPMLAAYYVLVLKNGHINMSVREYGQSSNISTLFFIGIGILGSILYCIASILIEKYKFSVFLAYLGRNSLILLCSHIFAFALVNAILSKVSQSMLSNLFSPIWYRFVLELAISILLAFHLTRVLKLWRKSINI